MPVTLDKFEYATDAAARAVWGGFIPDKSYTVGTNYTGNHNMNQRMVFPSSAFSQSGVAIKIRLKGHSAAPQTLTGASIGERSGSTGNFVSAPTRITFGGSNSGIIPAGGYLTSDRIEFNIDETKSYLIHLYFDSGAGSVSIKYGTAGNGRYYILDSGVDNTLTQNISGYSNDAVVVAISDVYIEVASVYSESTIKYSGSYSMKVVALQTFSLNQTITRTISPTINLTDQDDIKIWVRTSRTGTNIKIGLHDSGGTTTESNISVSEADTWEQKTIDISAVANANKDAIDSIIVTILNADAENIIYLDEMLGYADGEGSGSSGSGISRARVVNGV